MSSSKACSKCALVQPLDNFHNSKKTRDGKVTRCKACVALHYRANRDRVLAYQKELRARDGARISAREKARRDARREAGARSCSLRKYGITEEQYADMLAAQGGVCAICERPETTMRNGRPRNLCIDHDHTCCDKVGSCGECIRGLLCNGCNRALGYLNDRRDLAIAVLSYLTKHTKEEIPWQVLTATPPISTELMNWSPSWSPAT